MDQSSTKATSERDGFFCFAFRQRRQDVDGYEARNLERGYQALKDILLPRAL